MHIAGRPTAVDDGYGLLEDSTLSVSAPGVLGNDGDPDGDPLAASLVSGAAHGLLTLNPDGSFAYTPDPNYRGQDTFEYAAGDGAGGVSHATVTLTVAAVNDVPTLVAVNTLAGAVEDADFTVTYAMLAAAADEADVDGDALSFRIESVTSGTLTKGGSPVVPGSTLLGVGESLVWHPAANANGILNAFTVKAWDGQAVSALPVQVRVDVAAEQGPRFVGVISWPGGAAVYVYDCDSTADVALANVRVSFGGGNSISSITLAGSKAVYGLGLVVSGASSVGSIKDSRTGLKGDLAFIASAASIKSIQLKSGIEGHNLNGLTLGPMTFPSDVDGDGSTTDLTAIYCAGSIGTMKIAGVVGGDIWVGGASAKGYALKALSLPAAGYHGDLFAAGSVGSISLAGSLASSVRVAGDLSSFQIKGGDLLGVLDVSGKAGSVSVLSLKDADTGLPAGGWLRAGADVHVGGRLDNLNLSRHETDSADDDFGVRAGGFGRIALGRVVLAASDLPYAAADFRVILEP